MGNLREALKAFKRVHNKYPENREALTFLIATCRDLGIPYDEYNQRLNKLEREQISSSNDYDKYYNQSPTYSPNNYQGEDGKFN
jgi:hypothetical protein